MAALPHLGPTDTQSLSARLDADPRIRQAMQSNRNGGMLDAAALATLGYQVPEGYRYAWGGRNGYGTLLDNRQGYFETPKGALTYIGALGGLGALGLASNGAAAGASAFDAPAVDSAAGAANLASISGTGLPLGSIAPGVGATGAGIVNGGGIGSVGAPGANILNQLLSAKGLAGLAGLATTLATRPNNTPLSVPNVGGGSSVPALNLNQPNDPRLEAMLNIGTDRVTRTDPLHQAITQLAMSRLPTNVQR